MTINSLTKLISSSEGLLNEDPIEENLLAANFKPLKEMLSGTIMLAVYTGAGNFTDHVLQKLQADDHTVFSRSLLLFVARQVFKESVARLQVDGVNYLPEVVQMRLNNCLNLAAAFLSLIDVDWAVMHPSKGELDYTLLKLCVSSCMTALSKALLTTAVK